MTVPTHFKFTFRGIFQGTPETWSFGVHYARALDLGGDAGLSDIDESVVSEAITTFLAAAKVSNAVECTDWRAYVIGTDGRMEGNGPLLHEFAPNTVKGNVSDVLHPPQCTIAVTTVATNRGPARFGRFYIPGSATGLGGDWRVPAATAQEIGGAAAAFLKRISDAIDLPGSTASARGVNVSDRPLGGPGTMQDIDHVEVGRVYDTLRNRRKSLLEDREIRAHIDW